MKRLKIILLLLFCYLGFYIDAQEKNDSTEYDLKSFLQENNANIKKLLDYRYRGGSGAFERDFFRNFEYNDDIRQKCIIGTVIISFTIHCDGSLGKFNIINPLDKYLNSQLYKFFIFTKDSWNKCNDIDYEYFEVPILFTVKGVRTEAQGFIVFEADKSGYPCKNDSYYLDEFRKFKSNKPYKALRALDELIRRNPYNQQYINDKNLLFNTFPKLKKKIKKLSNDYMNL